MIVIVSVGYLYIHILVLNTALRTSVCSGKINKNVNIRGKKVLE